MTRPWLPAEDREAAPLTGFGRPRWAAVADHLLDGVAAHASPSGASLVLPGPRAHPGTPLEGFARTFLLGCIRLAGGERPDLVPGYARALRAGATPGGAESWPRARAHAQTTVEAASIALGLHLSREHLWDHLDETVRAPLVDWLASACGLAGADNNHMLFPAMVTAFLGSVGAPHDPAVMDRALARAEDLYVGDGWYTDGPGRRFDHYAGWAMNLYPLLIARMAEREDWQRLYAARLHRFLDDERHLVGRCGAPVHQGRSLIYRWAAAAPFWAGAMAGATPLTHGQTRRVASGMLAAFVERGAADDAALGDGWLRPFPPIAQGYSGPGSAYWVSKGFLGLALPASHPLWTAREEPLETDRDDVTRPFSAPRWLVHSTADDAVVRLLNHGSDGHPQRDDDHYRRLAFSDRTGPEVGASVRDNVVDVPVGGQPARHTGLLGGRVTPSSGASRYVLDAGGRDVTVDVVTVVLERAEVRVARLRGAVELPVRLTGWAVAGDQPPVIGHDPGAWARDAAGLTSTLVPLLGGTVSVHRSEGTNAFGHHSAVPIVDLAPSPEVTRHAAAVVALSGPGWTPHALLDHLEVDVREHEVEVRAGDARHVVPWARPDVDLTGRLGQGVFDPDGGAAVASTSAPTGSQERPHDDDH